MNVLFALCFLMSPDRSAPLPEWSIPWITPALALAKQDRLPVEAQNHPVWRIYEQHSYLRKEGSLFCRVRLIQIVLNDDWGARNGQVLLGDSGQQGEILSAFGWHQAPNGRVERLKPEGIFYVGDGQTNNISQDQYTIAHFENLRRFSVVLVESTQKVERFLGPVFLVKPSDQAPTRYFEVDVPEEPLNQFRLLPFRMDTWSLEQKKSDRSWSLLNYPAPLSQAPCSNLPGDFPGIVVAFSDARYANWDAFAKWYVGIFAEAAQAGDLAAPTSAKPEIEAMIQKVAGNLYYRQVYLTAQRGWVPEPGAKVWQKGFGDCKDLVSACAFEAQQRQFTVLPVLASIGPSNRMKPDDPVFSGFNHLIGAIPLSQSLNLEAEVMVGDRRFLLFDPTQAHAPFGRLPRYYLDSDVLICTTQGGSWVHIEASMLEDNRYQVSINGQLDGTTATGQLQLAVQGDPDGFGSIYRQNRPALLERFTRSVLAIPAHVRLTPLPLDANRPNTLHFDLVWPDFLTVGPRGTRLNETLDPMPIQPLDRWKNHPLFRAEETPQVWQIQLNGGNGPASQNTITRKDPLTERYLNWRVTASGLEINLQLIQPLFKVYQKDSDSIWQKWFKQTATHEAQWAETTIPTKTTPN